MTVRIIVAAILGPALGPNTGPVLVALNGEATR